MAREVKNTMSRQRTHDVTNTGLQIHAHDLLWGMPVEQIAAAAPSWVHARVAAGGPVVVRRDQQHINQVAVGVRGLKKSERYAAWLSKDAITRIVKPEQIRKLTRCSSPVQQTLNELEQLLHEKKWGITGSYAFQAATGEQTVTSNSDLDLLLRQPTAFTLAEGNHLYTRIKLLPVTVDVQIDTGHGGFSLADWVTSNGRVLLKTNQGPQLVANPWFKEDAR